MAISSRNQYEKPPDENVTADFRKGVKKILLDFDSSPARYFCPFANELLNEICHGLASKISQSTQKGIITKNDVFNCINKLFPENIKYRIFEQIKNNQETSGIMRNLVNTVSQRNVTDNAAGEIQQLIQYLVDVAGSATETIAEVPESQAQMPKKNNPETSGIIRNLVSTVSQLNVTDNAMGEIQLLIQDLVDIVSATEAIAEVPESQEQIPKKNNPEASGIMRNLVNTVSQLNVTDNAMGEIQQLIQDLVNVTVSTNERTDEVPGSQARVTMKRKFSECSTEINVDPTFSGMLANKEKHTRPLPFNALSAPVDSIFKNCGMLISETAHHLQTSLMNPAVFPVDHTAQNKHQEEDDTTAMDVDYLNRQKNEMQTSDSSQMNNNELLEIRSQRQDELQHLSSVQSSGLVLHESVRNDSSVRQNRNNEEQGSLRIRSPPDTNARLISRRRPTTNYFFKRWYLLPFSPFL